MQGVVPKPAAATEEERAAAALDENQSGPARFAAALFAAGYFLYFAVDGLRAHFVLDDLANIGYYFNRGPWRLILAQFEFASTYLRPMGGLFYMPLFHFAGFTPLPYRMVALLVIAANVVLFYCFAKLLTGSKPTAWLAALLVSFHPHLMDMVYSNAVIYDVLCFSFYFATLVWYIRIRSRGRLLNWRETAVCLGLFICALNSKEMAVSLPVTMALYELFYHPPARFRPRSIGLWLAGEGRVMCLAGLVTGVFIAGKTLGADPLIAIPAYRPEFTLHRFMQSVSSNLRSMFYLPDHFPQKYLSISAAALLALACIRKSRLIAFCVLFAILSELPIAFIGRAWSCLYVPLAAWSLLVSSGVWNAARLAARYLAPRRARAIAAAALVMAFVLSYAVRVRSEKQRLQPILIEGNEKTWSAIQEFAKLKAKPRPGSSIVFLNDPFEDWDMMFLAELTYRDRSLQLHLQRKTPLPPAELAKMDYIFDYRDGKFLQVKP